MYKKIVKQMSKSFRVKDFLFFFFLNEGAKDFLRYLSMVFLFSENKGKKKEGKEHCRWTENRSRQHHRSAH